MSTVVLRNAGQVGAIGGEYMSFTISTKDLEKWNFMIANAGQPVTITLSPAQGELDLDRENENDDGDDAGDGEGMNGHGGRKKKQPTGRHAVAGDEQRE